MNFNNFLKINKWSLFFSIISISWGIQFYMNEFLMTSEVWYTSYGEQMTLSQIDRLMEWKDEYWWFSYALAPVMILLKLSMISIALLIGGIFLDEKLSFRKTFGVLLILEFIFLLPGLIQIAWFSFFEELQSMQDLVAFTPWALSYFIDTNLLDQWMLYPINLINGFELIYVLSMIVGISYYLNDAFNRAKASKLVFYGYGSGLFTWVVFVTFLTIQVS